MICVGGTIIHIVKGHKSKPVLWCYACYCIPLFPLTILFLIHKSVHLRENKLYYYYYYYHYEKEPYNCNILYGDIIFLKYETFGALVFGALVNIFGALISAL